MPLPQRVSQQTSVTLKTQFAANYGTGRAATALSDNTAILQRMPKPRVRAILRKVTDIYSAVPATIELDLFRGVTPIADGAVDTIADTVAAQAKTVQYTLVNGGSDLVLHELLTAAALTNCTVSINPSWLIGAPAIERTGGLSGVALHEDSPTSVPVQGTSTVDVVITPTAVGAWSFTLSVANNDATENPYNWTVNGTAVAATPEIDVLEGANPLADGGTDTVPGNPAATVMFQRTYTIDNIGGAALGITVPVVIGGLVNCTATVSTAPSATVAAFGTTSLVIDITPAAAGAFSFTVSFANTDASENPFNWTVDGTAV